MLNPFEETYEICVRGTLSGSWSDWFDRLQVRTTTDGRTLLYGPIADQAALHGILERIRDMGLELISLTRHEQTRR